MGAGRRTETHSLNGQAVPIAGNGLTRVVAPQRRLAEQNKLGSVIFGCTHATYSECITNKLFGLPYSHHTYVDYIVPGMPIFLFNYTERKMHGVFEAISEGSLNIGPYAWTGSDGARTQYPAQVRVQLRSDFSRIVTLTETIFKETLKESYHTTNHFCFEVDLNQTEKLIQLFERALGSLVRPAPPRSAPTAWQTPFPTKVWKKSSNAGSEAATESSEAEDRLKLKKPPVVVLSEWEKGTKYFPSSSTDVITRDDTSQQQQSVWSRRSNEEDYFSDESDAPKSLSKTQEVSSEEDLLLLSRNEMAEQEQGLHAKSISGYRPKLDGPLGMEPSLTDTLTIAQSEEKQRVYERLRQLTSGAKDMQGMQLSSSQVPEIKDGEFAVSSATARTAEWESVAQDFSSIQEPALVSDERERLASMSIIELEPSISTTVNKNLEASSLAVAQIRQGEMESRSDNLERRFAVLESSHASLAAEVQTLKLEVSSLRRQLGYADVSAALDFTHGNFDHDVRTRDALQARAPLDVYLLGGLGDQLSKLESVMVWTPSTDQLRTVAPMLSPRCCAAASVLGEHIYVFGGGDGSTWYDSVERYDARANQWLACAPMKTKRGSLGGAAVGDRLYALGGGNGQVSFSEVESYDPYVGAWYPCAAMGEKRFCVATAELGGALYSVGGFDGDQYLMSMERFDPREALWSKLPSMSVKRGSLSAAVLNGKIYALGGYDGDGILDVVEVFDVRAGRWEVGLQMCCQRAYGAVGVIGEELYYVGGLAEDEVVDSAPREIIKQTEDDEDGSDGEDDGYRSWRSQWQASWQHCFMGSSVPGLTSNSSHQIQRFTEATGWHLMRPRVIGKRSCLAAVVF